jgi:hypothetical protein
MIEFAMEAHNCVGDEIEAGGVVTGSREDILGRSVAVEVWVTGTRGRTVRGNASVVFPPGDG